MEQIYYNNNDVCTFFIALLGGSFYLICFDILKKIYNNKNLSRNECIFLTIIYTALTIRNIEYYRWFKTQIILTDITIKKTFSHDTRSLSTNFYFDEDNKFKIYNTQSGDITSYVVSSKEEVFTISKNIVPYFLAISDPGKNIKIEAWRWYYLSESPYEIFKIKTR